MRITGTINTGALIFVVFFSCCFSDACAQASQNQTAVQTKQIAAGTAHQSDALLCKDVAKTEPAKKSTLRMSFVKTADFYLRDGQLTSGKLVSEDKNKIVIERLEESKVVVSTYSKREIDSRTLHIRNVPEYKYYLDLAEYFAGRTWDFRDDPDDFIQAIRCYEKAKQSVEETRLEPEKIEQINEKIKQLQADRGVWTREVESRARLKKLEFEATIETRIKELEDKVNANSQYLYDGIERLDEFMADMKGDYQKLEEGVSGMNKDMSRQLEILEGRIEANRRLIDSRWRSRPYYYYPYRRKSRPDDNNGR